MNIETLLKFHRPNHSNAQMDYIITGKTGLTNYGRLKQALREMESRRQAYIQIVLDLAECGTPASIEDCEFVGSMVPILKQRLRIQNLQRAADQTLRELAQFAAQAEHYYEASAVTEENIEALEEDLMVTQVSYQAGLDILSNGHVSQGTFAAACSLRMGHRASILHQIAKNPVELVDNVVNWPAPFCPKVDPARIAAIRGELNQLVSMGNQRFLEWSQV